MARKPKPLQVPLPKIGVRTHLPMTGLNGIRVGDIYERSAFSDDQFAVARIIWRMFKGKIQDPGPHQGKEVVLIQSHRPSEKEKR